MEAPWENLAKVRKAKGLTQVQLASGIVSQSMICQIERGRVIPSESTLFAIAKRLQLDPNNLADVWIVWRRRQEFRSQLWNASCTSDRRGLRRALANAARYLLPFEQNVYMALHAALWHDILSANHALEMAWSVDQPWIYERRHGPRRFGLEESVTGAWTFVDKVRALVVDAKTRVLIYEQSNRTIAAGIWRQKCLSRLQPLARRGMIPCLQIQNAPTDHVTM